MTNQHVLHLNEPNRQSIFDCLQETLKIANRKMFLHRAIYIGQHNMPNIQNMFESIVNTVNDGYYDEPLTGLLIYYPQYFCHVVEGSEDGIGKHFILLINQDISLLGSMKLIATYHHINQRFFPEWMYLTGKPPTLLKDIEKVETDLEVTAKQVKYFVRKMFNLATSLRMKLETDSADPLLSQISLNPPPPRSSSTAYSLLSIEKKDTGLPTYFSSTDTRIIFLPEYNLLDYLCKSESLQDIRIFAKIYEVIPEMEAYEDTIWPVPCDFVPYDVFDKPIDPVPDLPSRQLLEKSEIHNTETTTE